MTEDIVRPEETERLQYLGNHYCNQWRSVPKREREGGEEGGEKERRRGSERGRETVITLATGKLLTSVDQYVQMVAMTSLHHPSLAALSGGFCLV